MKKTLLLITATILTLQGWANPPALKGFSYTKVSQPTGKEWESPEQYAHGKEQPHAYFFPFANREAAQKVLPKHSEYYLSLNGTWKFHWVANPDERPTEFYQPQFNTDNWDDVTVPMNWNVYGLGQDGSQKYGTPIYVNQPVIFQHQVKKDDWKGGVMRTPPTNWTTYKARNEVGSYRRTFTIPKEWQKREVFLQLDGVDSFFYLWINGHYVGFSKNSRNLAEFNITPYLQKNGHNTVAIEVYRNSDGSFLEAQDMFRLPGIFRDVALVSKPKVHIRNLQVTPKLTDNYTNGQLDIVAEIRNLSSKEAKGYSIEYTLYSTPLYSDKTTKVANIASKSFVPNIGKEASTLTKTNITLTKPNLWSAEKPYRYVLIAELKDSKGKTVETSSTYTGFRQVEIKDTPAHLDEFGLSGRYFYVNGKTVKLKGVNRHETNPSTGHVITPEQMEQEVFLMKRANINHVRNSHYPTSPYWYYLCDKYGIYLEDEANIESHQYYYGEASLSHVPEFKNHHVNRMLEMVYANFNNPSIVIWSLGNEAGPGKNFVASYQATKAVDPSRPVQYERNNSIVDMGSNQYPSIHWVQNAVKGTMNIKYPFHISEYAHSMGNACGGLDDYWKAIESTNFICGGAIWDWVDQSLYNHTSDGLKYLAYGGDFGDTPNDGMFVMNGVMFADLTPKPQYFEVQKVYQHIGVTDVNLATQKNVEVFNKYYDKYLENFTIRWTLQKDGKAIETGTIAPLKELAPRSKTTITIPYQSTIDSLCEYFVKIEFLLKDDMPWAKAGFVQAKEQLAIHAPKHQQNIAGKASPIRVENSSNNILALSGEQFTVEFDINTGSIHQLSYGNNRVIEPGQGPKLSAFRAAADNDNWARNGWVENGLHNLKHRTLSHAVKTQSDGSTQIFFYTLSQAPNAAKLTHIRASGRYKIDELYDRPFGENDFKFTTATIWTVYPDGTISITANIVGNKPTLPLARLGFEMVIPQSYENYTYYGRGPINNYADRKASQFIEIHQSKVIDQFIHFPKPQTMGNRENVRWASLTNKDNEGILILSQNSMSTSALPYSALEMLLAPHPHELPPAGDTHLHVDLAVNGLGGFSCGQGPPLVPYRVFATPHTFTFAIRPLFANDNPTEKAKIELPVYTTPTISRDLTGMVHIQSTGENKVLYQIDNSRPKVYTKPFELRDAATITVWNEQQKEYAIHEKFNKIETVPISVVYASSEDTPSGVSASNLVDGDPKTIWHSMYSVTVAQYPHWIDFDAHQQKEIKGITYLPRQDGGQNGDIKDYIISVSSDNEQWKEVAKGSFANNKTLKRVMFDKPQKARYIRFTALNAQNGADFASGAEFTVIAD